MAILGDFYRSVIVYIGAYYEDTLIIDCLTFSKIRIVFEWIQLFQLYYILWGVNLIMIFFAKKQRDQPDSVEDSIIEEDLESRNQMIASL